MTGPSTHDQTPTTLDDLVGGVYNEQAALGVLRMVAQAVVELADRPRNKPFAPPYSPVAQWALDRICLLGAYRYPNTDFRAISGPRYPRGLTELLAWCRDRPVSEWNFLELPEAFEEITDRLLEADPLRPSRLCLRLALGVDPNTPHWELEKQVMGEVLRLYQESGREGGFAEFRRSIVEAPVLTEREFALQRMHSIGGIHAQDLPLNRIYNPAHDKYFNPAGEAGVCRYCGLLLVSRDRSWVCEITSCPSREQLEVGAVLRRDGGDLHHVVRPIREFVVAPARISAYEREYPRVPSPDREL
ncbi:hypothetical protein ACFO4E_19935 [Nocardiopsis mangrovi]|uniref:pPIWI-RE three-gene island domain-containing protein n=1 Tax=Nocardiopsis mangrovi TaxID=1179818 RepID=A0ABV9DZ04_9ACTN